MSESESSFKETAEAPPCPECGKPLHIKSGKSGAFWGCTGYPDCHYTKPLSAKPDIHIVKILDDICCPECGGDLAVKTGKYGMFIGCIHYPDCTFMVKDSDDSDYEPVDCPKCKKGALHMRANKKGHRFYACDQYPKCDYLVNELPLNKQCEHCNWPIVTVDSHDHVSCPECGKSQ